MTDTIDTLLALDDAGLMKKIGMSAKLETFKTNLAEAAKLTGKARAEVAADLKRTLEPEIYIGDLKYTIDRAKRHADKDSAENLLESCGCAPDPC